MGAASWSPNALEAQLAGRPIFGQLSERVENVGGKPGQCADRDGWADRDHPTALQNARCLSTWFGNSFVRGVEVCFHWGSHGVAHTVSRGGLSFGGHGGSKLTTDGFPTCSFCWPKIGLPANWAR